MAAEPIDRARLPIRRPPFQGTINRTLAGSEPDWGQIGHIRPPEGAPNVLVVLYDDTGCAAWSPSPRSGAPLPRARRSTWSATSWRRSAADRFSFFSSLWPSGAGCARS